MADTTNKTMINISRVLTFGYPAADGVPTLNTDDFGHGHIHTHGAPAQTDREQFGLRNGIKHRHDRGLTARVLYRLRRWWRP